MTTGAGARERRKFGALRYVNKFWKNLDNPFLLMAEGFVIGAIFFWAMRPDSADAIKDRAPTESAIARVGPR